MAWNVSLYLMNSYLAPWNSYLAPWNCYILIFVLLIFLVTSSVPRSWINNWADFFQRCEMQSVGAVCDCAREVPCGARVSGKIGKNGKIWFFSKKIDIPEGNIEDLSKIDERSMETYQIDPRGHVGTRNSEICSYWVVHRLSKSLILMWDRTVISMGGALLPNSGSLARQKCHYTSKHLLGRSGARFWVVWISSGWLHLKKACPAARAPGEMR